MPYVPEDVLSYPPGQVLFATKALDMICRPLYCANWRSYLPFESTWLSYKVGDIRDSFPELLSYSDYQQSNPDGSLFNYAFETPSTDLAVATSPMSIVVLIGLVLILRGFKAVLLPFFSGIGRRAGRATHGEEWEKNNETRIQKFGEYVFRLIYHLCISIYGIASFSGAVWWKDTTELFRGYPHHEVLPGMAWYYLIQSAYNLEALVSLAEISLCFDWRKFRLGWAPTIRGDFREMAVHHVVTNCLALGSSYFRLTRAGSMVFMVHDISDVPVDLSKLANFLKWKVTTAVCFVTMVLLWLIFRLTIFPFVIYRSVIYESILVVEQIDFIYYRTYLHVFVVMIGLILLLHLVWFSMFIQMGYLLIFKGERHDLSEHKQGENQDAMGNDSKKTN